MITHLAFLLLQVTQGRASAPSKQQIQEKESLLHLCQKLEQSAPATIDGIRDRTDCWKRMQLEGMDDSLVSAHYQAAVHDYDAAMQSDSIRRATEAGASTIEQRLIEAQRAITAHNFARADSIVTSVLALQPQNQRALAFKDRLVALRRSGQLRTMLFIVGGLVLALALILGISARVVAVRRERRFVREKTVAANRQAMIEIVDGIGRGKLYTLTGPVFRIGSAESERPEERNDLILSDAASHVSRYHCSILKKDGQYFLIDSSLNGTYLDDELLERGTPRLLADGAEFSLAGMSRLKFMLV